MRPGLKTLGPQKSLADTGRNESEAVAILSPRWKFQLVKSLSSVLVEEPQELGDEV